VEERKPAVGKMCELKSHRIWGRERDAGCDFRGGMLKREKDAMPPEAMSAVVMLTIWMVCVADIFEE
jgi:hypothetical protein